MTKEQIMEQLDAQWAKRSFKLDWLSYEQLTADILTSDSLSDYEKVCACKEALDAFTRRGHFANGSNNPYLTLSPATR